MCVCARVHVRVRVCVCVCVCVKAVSHVALADLELEIILHVLEFRGCTVMPGLCHAGDQTQALYMQRKNSADQAVSLQPWTLIFLKTT